jgi:hypothetical protein
MVTGASVFLLATLVLSIAGGAALTDADGGPAEGLTAFSYVNVLVSSLLGATAGVWQASRADLASRTDAVIAGFAGPSAAAALMLVIGGGGWSPAEILLSLIALAAGAGAGAGIMARRLQYVATD